MKSKIVKPYIERAVIEINGGCNYKCEMCTQTNPGRDIGFLKKMELKNFEDILKQCVDRGVQVINLEGSGEATLVKDLPKYIQLCTEYGVKSYIFSNGLKFRGKFMRECINAGLSRIRFSVIGYDREQYLKWMNCDNFEQIKHNAIESKKYAEETNSKTIISSYHLIGDNNNQEYEIKQYIKNWINPTNLLGEIWKMHNWSGVYDNPNKREGRIKTCGRPFAPEITVRAGGINGNKNAVHPCCQVLGRDSESVLGHMTANNFDEIWNGEEYQKLREGHITGNYPSYCKNCDFLVDDPEVLVWCNHDISSHKIAGTEFNLGDFR